MKAVAYCRVSTNEIDQKNSLNNQMKHYNALFKTKGYSKVDVGMLYSKEKGEQKIEGLFADEGITGTKKKNRRAFEYMMKCAANREFDIIFCKNIARFARNVGDGANDLKLLKSYGIDVIFEDGNLSYKNNEAIINMFLSMAQEESRAKSVACKFGIRKAQEQGKWTSNCPFGYNRVNGYLQINESESEIVKQVYKHYVNDGWGHNKILRWLNESNIPTKKGGKWWQQHVKNLLTNPIYIGIQINHKQENFDVNINLIKDVPKNEWITHEKEELKIISDDLWEQAQDIDKRRTEEYKSKHRHSDTNLLSTVCICGNCGGILRRKKRKTKAKQVPVWTGEYEWVCQNNDMYGKTECDCRNTMSEAELLEFCKNKIQEYRNKKEILEDSLSRYIKKYYDFNTKSKLNVLENEIEAIKNEYDNRIRLNSKGIITDDELETFLIKYREELNQLEAKEHKLKNIDNEVENVKRKFHNFINYLDNINLDNLQNADLKKIFSKVIVKTIIVNPSMSVDEIIKTAERNGDIYYLSGNRKKLKLISAEHMFMNIEENQLFTNL